VKKVRVFDTMECFISMHLSFVQLTKEARALVAAQKVLNYRQAGE
jgi:hypothetical protein